MRRRKIVQETLNFEHPRRIPRQLWVSPLIDIRLKYCPEHAKPQTNPETWWSKLSPLFPQQIKKLAWIRRHFPEDLIFCPPLGLPQPERKKKPQRSKEPGENSTRFYRDEWGCVFERTAQGVYGSVRSSLIKSWEDLEGWRPPEHILCLDRSRVNAFCRATERFVLAGSWIRPFERLQFLRGHENLLADLKTQPPELFELLRRVHSFYLKEMEMWARTEVDALCLMDDWGSATRLLISPSLFRRIFLPLYRDYASLAKHYKKYLFFHSDGHILEIIPDLIEIGVDALNCQVVSLEPENLAPFRGRLTFWGASDLIPLLATGRRQEIEVTCERIYSSLFDHGGFIAQAEFSPDVSPANLVAYFRIWNKITKNAGKNGRKSQGTSR